MKPLEQTSQRGGPVLDYKDIQSIFGKIPDILNVHVKIMVCDLFCYWQIVNYQLFMMYVHVCSCRMV